MLEIFVTCDLLVRGCIFVLLKKTVVCLKASGLLLAMYVKGLGLCKMANFDHMEDSNPLCKLLISALFLGKNQLE